MSFTLPITDHVLIFAISMLIFLIVPLLFKFFRLPGIIGIIIVGALIGPNALHLLSRNEAIVLLGEIGLVYIMFTAGLEININKFIEKLDRSIVFGLISFIVPIVVGTAAGHYILGMSIPAALLFASIFASRTLLAYPVTKRLGIVNNEAVTTTIGGTILTDTLALLVLAVVLASMDGELNTFFWVKMGGSLLLFIVSAWLIVPRLAKWFFSKLTEESYFEFLFVLTVTFILSYLAKVAGVEPIIGAFFAGLLLNRLIPNTSPLMNRIEFVGNALFIPFFLLSVGMLVDINAFFQGGQQLKLAAWLVGLALVTKYLSSWITGKIYSYDNNQVMSMFGLSLGQAAAALAIVLIGFDAGLFDHDMINAVVMMILIIGIISPQMVSHYGKKLALTDQVACEMTEATTRVLVSFSLRSTYKQLLLDLALMLRDQKTDEPLHVLSVVRREGENAEKNVVDAEKMLQDITSYVACAEVPVVPHVRLNYNVASGIIRAIIENRISTVVIGWDGVHSPKESVIGSIIDQLLGGTDKLVLVSMIRRPLCNTKEMVLIIPPYFDHNTGSYAVIDAVRRVAQGTSAPIRALVIRDDISVYKDLFKKFIPDSPIKFEPLGTWSDLIQMLHSKNWSEDNLFILASAHRGTPSWHPILQTLPKRISSSFEGNLIIAYPPTDKKGNDSEY